MNEDKGDRDEIVNEDKARIYTREWTHRCVHKHHAYGDSLDPRRRPNRPKTHSITINDRYLDASFARQRMYTRIYNTYTYTYVCMRTLYVMKKLLFIDLLY